MRQSWHSRALKNGPEARRHGRRARRVHIGLAVGLAFLMGACSAQDGTTAVQLSPRPIAGDGHHRAYRAPKQRWGSAAGLDPVGHVYGQFKTTAGTPKPIDGNVDVRDNLWHHVALSVTADAQTLYVDGAPRGSKPATDGALDHSLLTFNQAGAGWATNPAAWPSWGTAAKRYFNGSIDEIALYGHALSEQTAKAHWQLGGAQADRLSTVTLPSGKIATQTTYDTGTDRVQEYTDGNGGTWKIGNPTVYGGDTDLRRAVQVLDPADRAYLYEYDALAGRLLRSGSPLGISTRPEDKPLPPSPTPAPSRPRSAARRIRANPSSAPRSRATRADRSSPRTNSPAW